MWALGRLLQSLTNRGVARLCASEFLIDDRDLRFFHTDGFFLRGPAIVTYNYLHVICEIALLDNRLLFFAFNAAQDMQGRGGH